MSVADTVEPTEAEWQQTVVDTASAFGWWSYHNRDSRGSNEGWPDLVLVRPPRFVLVELKTNKGRVRPRQAIILDMLRACCLDVRLWRPKDWDDEVLPTLRAPAARRGLA